MVQVFDGITVLDFTSGRAGGVATMVMSDFGAEVIKVEPPGGEKFRDSPGSIQWNRGKKSIVLDLKTSDGRDNARKLAQLSDVVVEGFRPGVTKRSGIDYDSLRRQPSRAGVCHSDPLREQGALRQLQGLRRGGCRQERKDDDVLRAEPQAGAQLRRHPGRLPRLRHGADSRHHIRPLRAGEDRPGSAGGDQYAEGRNHLRSRVLGSRPDGREPPG